MSKQSSKAPKIGQAEAMEILSIKGSIIRPTMHRTPSYLVYQMQEGRLYWRGDISRQDFAALLDAKLIKQNAYAEYEAA